MKAYVFISEEDKNKEKAIPASVHFSYENLTEEDRKGGNLLDIPPFERRPGFYEVLWINPQTLQLWYEYEPITISKTPEQILQDRVASIEVALAGMMGV